MTKSQTHSNQDFKKCKLNKIAVVAAAPILFSKTQLFLDAIFRKKA